MQNEARNIFISYRRADAPGHAGRIYDSLARVFGAEQIFMDVSAIRPGESFGAHIDHTLKATGAVVVVIGREWMNLLRQRQSENTVQDFVRRETATALQRDVLVVPVLVEDAPMPAARELPEDLRPLADRNALEVSDSRWEHDMARLSDALTQAKGVEKLEGRKRRNAWVKPWLLVVAGCAALAVGVWKISQQRSPQEIPVAEISPTPSTVGVRVLFQSDDAVLQDFLQRLTDAVQQHDWSSVLVILRGSDGDAQIEIGADERQAIALRFGLKAAGNSLVEGDTPVQLQDLNRIEFIEVTSMTGPDQQGMLTVHGEASLNDGNRLKVNIPLRRNGGGGYESSPAADRS